MKYHSRAIVIRLRILYSILCIIISPVNMPRHLEGPPINPHSYADENESKHEHDCRCHVDINKLLRIVGKERAGIGQCRVVLCHEPDLEMRERAVPPNIWLTTAKASPAPWTTITTRLFLPQYAPAMRKSIQRR
jgi:hypothetical protein